jgi:hypothetical protein
MKMTGVTFEVRCRETFVRDGETHAVRRGIYLCRRVEDFKIFKGSRSGHWQILNDRGSWINISAQEYDTHFDFWGRVNKGGRIPRNPVANIIPEGVPA